ncbi:MAG: Ig-like domain-containing protein, partial [Clostridia bacterium]|nr:Ig-like domain-containing protein [Clostridia bacterium]
KDDMASYLFGLRPYANLQAVIDAIRNYLNSHQTPDPPKPGDEVVSKVDVSPKTVTMAPGNKREVVLTVTTTTGRMSAANIKELISLSWTGGEKSQQASIEIKPFANDDQTLTLILTANNQGKDTLTVSVGGKTNTITVTVNPPVFATGIRLNKTSLKLVSAHALYGSERLTYTLSPANSTDNIIWSSSNEAVATVDDGVVTAVSPGKTLITVSTGRTSADGKPISDDCEVLVFRDENDVVVYPDNIILMPGAYHQVEAYTFFPNKQLYWESDDRAIATVNQTGRISAPWDVAITDPDGVSTKVKVSVREGNSFGNSASVDVTVKQSSGVTVYLENSVMYAGEVQQLDLDVWDKTLQNQRYYVQVTGGVGGLAAECITPMPVGPNDKIEIRARSTGVGPAAIRVFTNPTFTGNPVSETVTVVVSPMSVDGVSFDHSGTSGNTYTGTTNYPAGTIKETQYGYILEMKLADRTGITPKVTLPGSADRINLAQPMTWFSFNCDYNREIMREVKTRYIGGQYRILDKSGGEMNYLVEKNGNILLDITFDDVFHVDEYNPYIPPPGLANGDIVWRTGYFKFEVVGDEKLRFQREADMKRVYSSLLSAQNGNLVPNNTQPTGLAAVVMTPQRGNLTRDEIEEWGDLFYNTVELFVNGKFNPIIAPQSGFALQKKQPNGTWGAPDKGLYDATPADISGGNYRITDINGNQILGNVPAIVIGDPNATTNSFFVRVLPDDLTKPQNRSTTMPWRMPDPLKDFDYLEQIGFAPGSMDEYIFHAPAVSGSQNPLDYPYLFAQVLPSTEKDPNAIYITKLDDRNHYVIIEVVFPSDSPPPGGSHVMNYDYSITQYSKLGFAPIGSEAPRQPAAMASTGVPALKYALTLTAQEISMQLIRTVYLADAVNLPTPVDPIANPDAAWGNLFFQTLQTACGLAGIDVATAIITKESSGSVPAGDIVIYGTGIGAQVIGTVAGTVRVVITAADNPAISVAVLYTVEE